MPAAPVLDAVAVRPLVLALLLVATPMLAGCNVKDWYNQQGTITVELAPLRTSDSQMDAFRSIRVAVYGVTVRQAGAADAKQFTFGENPLVVDLVEEARAGERVRLAEFKSNLRATVTVDVRMLIIEAIEANGNSMEVCRAEDVPERFPCFYQPTNGAWTYDDKPFAPPRGGEVVVGFPLTVHFEQQGRVSEYFLRADPNLVELTNHR